MFSKTVKEKYIKDLAEKCPSCGSGNIKNNDDFSFDSSTSVSRSVICETCGSLWLDIYNLTDIHLLHKNKVKDKPFFYED